MSGSMKRSALQLHPTLAADCHDLGDLAASRLLLHRNSALHWFILVPQTDSRDLLDLPREQRMALLDDATRVAKVLKGELAYPRVNVGALGLVVPQLHLHVVGRRENDPCWPAPVWGKIGAPEGTGDGYSVEALERLRALFGG